MSPTLEENEDERMAKKGFFRDGQVNPATGRQAPSQPRILPALNLPAPLKDYRPFIISPVTGKPTNIPLSDFPMPAYLQANPHM
jgi:hypothetical protein